MPESFTQLIAANKINFRPATAEDLDPWGKAVVLMFLMQHRMNFQIGDVKVGNDYCLKVDDPYLQYLDIYPDSMEFEWFTGGHQVDLTPHEVSLYLIKKEFGMKGTRVEMAPGIELWSFKPDEERN